MSTYLTTEREINTGDPEYDALFGINGHFSVCPQVIQAALEQKSVFGFQMLRSPGAICEVNNRSLSSGEFRNSSTVWEII